MSTQPNLYGGSQVVAQNMGLHLTDWSAWDKTILGGALVDSEGNVLFGTRLSASDVSLPPSPQIQDVEVWVKDEAYMSWNQPQPRIRLVNQGTQPITDINIMIPFQTEGGKTPQLEGNWYIPSQCQSRLTQQSNDNWAVLIQCAQIHIAPQATWPNESGLVFGLHYGDWSWWDRSNDPGLQGVLGEWSLSNAISLSQGSQP